MILTTKDYRVVCDRAARSLTIQRAGTWAPVSELRIPEDPGLAEAVIKAAEEIGGRAEAVKAEAPSENKQAAKKKVNK